MIQTDQKPKHPGWRIITASTREQFSEAGRLFREYADALDFALDFQDFESELTHIGVVYGPPEGCLILAVVEKEAVGCVALRKFAEGICEMKRLYVRPTHRKTGLGRVLAQEILAAGKRMGYSRMRLDTVATMWAATALYESLGFVRIAPYRYNPLEGAQFFEIKL